MDGKLHPVTAEKGNLKLVTYTQVVLAYYCNTTTVVKGDKLIIILYNNYCMIVAIVGA